MRYYMFSMDAERPEDCAREMRLRGISAVVSPPSARAAEACHREGLDVYACLGAFGMKKGDPDSWLSRDAFGDARKWFGSGCPCEDALFTRNLNASIDVAKAVDAKGIFADGLRFASPAPGDELFFSCFCPQCMAYGEKLGFDMERMRAETFAFAKTPGAAVPADWLAFRETRIREAFSVFRARLDEEGLASGAFTFADSLAPLVGQTANATKGLSILAPMLYRRYRKRPGIACLNDEYAALCELFQSRGDADPAASISMLTGVSPTGDGDAIRDNGFAPPVIAKETARSRKAFSGVLAPILQLDDELLSQSVRAATEAGADAVGFFAYDKEWFSKMPELQ